MISREAYIAATRFGLGMSPQDAATVSASPKHWLWQQIEAPQVRGDGFAALESSEQILKAALSSQQQFKTSDAITKKDREKEIRQEHKAILINELRAKMQLCLTTRTPFYERFVRFWSNHFTVSAQKGRILGIAGAYEREAIRPHVTGKFSDMLIAVAEHPAMLIYLDNAQSIGPHSIAGERRDKGLNENLAREIMELHTLGVGSGYTQTDVTTFAKVLTGWTIAGPNEPSPGGFDFVSRRHEPGDETILGKTYPDDDERQGIAVLRDLAKSPATAHHIATKLARHFVADDPPEEVVAHLAKLFLHTGGDLPSLYHALIDLPQAWDITVNPKVKDGYDLVVSAARASGRNDDAAIDYCLSAIKYLGDIPFTASSPAGFSDVARDLMGPDAMIRRVEWAQTAAVKLSSTLLPAQLAQITIGPVASGNTLSAVAAAATPKEALSILYGSPEFQRR